MLLGEGDRGGGTKVVVQEDVIQVEEAVEQVLSEANNETTKVLSVGLV